MGRTEVALMLLAICRTPVWRKTPILAFVPIVVFDFELWDTSIPLLGTSGPETGASDREDKARHEHTAPNKDRDRKPRMVGRVVSAGEHSRVRQHRCPPGTQRKACRMQFGLLDKRERATHKTEGPGVNTSP